MLEASAGTEPAAPTFGEQLCTRGRRLRGAVGSLILGLVALAFGAAAMGAWRGVNSGSAAMTSTLLLSAGAAAAGLGCVGVAIAGFTRVTFYEHAAVRRGLFTATRISYEEATVLRYDRSRHYQYTAYVGTWATVTLRAVNGRRISWTGRHRERARGFFRPRIEGADPLDAVVEEIAERIAARMLVALEAGRTVAWGGAFGWGEFAHFTQAGLVPASGPLRGETVPYGQIEGVEQRNGRFQIRRAGDTGAMLIVDSGGDNFWPGLVLLSALTGAPAPGPSAAPPA